MPSFPPRTGVPRTGLHAAAARYRGRGSHPPQTGLCPAAAMQAGGSRARAWAGHYPRARESGVSGTCRERLPAAKDASVVALRGGSDCTRRTARHHAKRDAAERLHCPARRARTPPAARARRPRCGSWTRAAPAAQGDAAAEHARAQRHGTLADTTRQSTGACSAGPGPARASPRSLRWRGLRRASPCAGALCFLHAPYPPPSPALALPPCPCPGALPERICGPHEPDQTRTRMTGCGGQREGMTAGSGRRRSRLVFVPDNEPGQFDSVFTPGCPSARTASSARVPFFQAALAAS